MTDGAAAKDFWDKLGSVSTFLSSVVIGIVGLWFTNSYNDRQAVRDARLQEQELTVLVT
jgi:hypothetical protein